MKITALALSSALFSAVLAAPSGAERYAKRQERRAARQRLTHPMIPSTANVEGTNNDNSTHVEYSSNWSGSVIESPPSGQTFDYVYATIVVPSDITSPSGGSAAASAWVGIDGDTCETAILQTGVDFNVDGNSVTYDAWYEWYPDYAYDFSISISAGDEIAMYVQTSSLKAGTAVIENLTTGKTVSKSLSSSSSLCGENAEWIVEDFEENGSLVNFADFSSVTFSGAVAKTASESLGPSSGTIIDIESNGDVLTSVTTGSSSVTVKYT